MKSNPFLSDIYRNIWLNHFGKDRQVISMACFANHTFIKNTRLPVYYNIGRNQTKGITFNLQAPVSNDHYGKCIVLYDVPDYFKPDMNLVANHLNWFYLRQYKGYRCNFNGHKSLAEYMQSFISKKSQGKFKRAINKLERNYAATYRFYGQKTSEDHLLQLIELLHQWMVKRFSEMKSFNNNLDTKEWEFHKSATLALIKEGKAGLFVVEANEKPLAITILYFSENTAYDVLRGFDIDYANYRPGTICTMKQIDWCISQGFRYLDFSKGHFEYKQRWCNESYNFEYQIYFDRKSIKATFFGLIFKGYYQLKTRLRMIGIGLLWQHIKFLLNFKSVRNM